MKCPDCGYVNLAGEETCESCSAPLSSLALPEAKAKKGVQKKLLEGTIKQIGIQNAELLPLQTSVAQAVRFMREHKIGSVLVGEKGKLFAICTERDILMEVAGLQDPEKVRLSFVMKAEPQMLHEDDAVTFAFHNMAMRDYRHIPIKRSDGTYGIISARDLLRYLCQ